MCESCHAITCYPACPAVYSRAWATCTLCGMGLTGEGHYARGRHRLCALCAENLSVRELLAMAGLGTVDELLLLLGFRRAD